MDPCFLGIPALCDSRSHICLEESLLSQCLVYSRSSISICWMGGWQGEHEQRCGDMPGSGIPGGEALGLWSHCSCEFTCLCPLEGCGRPKGRPLLLALYCPCGPATD